MTPIIRADDEKNQKPNAGLIQPKLNLTHPKNESRAKPDSFSTSDSKPQKLRGVPASSVAKSYRQSDSSRRKRRRPVAIRPFQASRLYDCNSKSRSKLRNLVNGTTDPVEKTSRTWTRQLKLGGRITFHVDVVDPPTARALEQEMSEKLLYRQYPMANGFEPRLHVLLNNSTTSSYQYHGVKMNAVCFEQVPALEKIAEDFARRFNPSFEYGKIPMKEKDEFKECSWSIGVDAIVYRNGQDYIGWHADNAQDEETIMSLVVAAPKGTTRTLCIQPLKQPPTRGAEQIELFPQPGDAYCMDSAMQDNYVHSILRMRSAVSCESERTSLPMQHRYSLVFRHGRRQHLGEDNGYQLPRREHLTPREPLNYIFGEIEGLHVGDCLSRMQLVQRQAHQSYQRGISGNKQVGCNAIILSDKNIEDQEFTGGWLRYVALRRVGAGAISLSQAKKLPIRVFCKLPTAITAPRQPKSSKASFKEPTSTEEQSRQSIERFRSEGSCPLYRYYGLYSVVESIAGKGKDDAIRFVLKSLPKNEKEEVMSAKIPGIIIHDNVSNHKGS